MDLQFGKSSSHRSQVLLALGPSRAANKFSLAARIEQSFYLPDLSPRLSKLCRRRLCAPLHGVLAIKLTVNLRYAVRRA